MRLEINQRQNQEYQVEKICQNANEWGVDAIYIDPVNLEHAKEYLGRNNINIVTTAGRDVDTLDAKVAAIDSAAMKGANEIIVCIPQKYIFDWQWNEIEKEIEQLKIAASAYHVFVWIGCRFKTLDRVCQVKMAEAIGEGAGLRVRQADVNDVAIAKICGVKHICLGLSEEDPSVEAIENFESFGVTQMVFKNKPPQAKTDKVTFNEL